MTDKQPEIGRVSQSGAFFCYLLIFEVIVKEIVTTIYECEHCQRYYKRKHFAIKHEAFCKNNPANRHKCFEWCVHLKMIDEVEESDDFFTDTHYKTFICDISGDEMHSYIAERRGMKICNYTLRMPIKCEDYK